SRTGATTKTVGAVGANPFLATGEARVILNEVNSSAASRFEGNLEVAGQMADVIIANPSGINIKGGGFINANKAIFTTGKPQLNADGSIQQFNVNQGKVTITAPTNSTLGLGGNNNNANYVDIYARALDLNAQLQAQNDIQVITGANTVSSDLQNITAITGTGTAPTLAVDVKALGGMYANNIYLMGTEKGLGVTNAGTLQAVNNLVITSAGKIEHSGTISSTSKTQGLVSVQTTGVGAAADINSSGSINSNSMLNIDSGNDLNINAKEIIINNGSLASSPLIISSKGNLNLAANSRIFNDAQSGDVYVDATNINLATNAGITSNRGSAYIQSQKDVVAVQGAKLIAAQNLNVSGKGKLSLTGNQIQASLGSINLQTDSSNTDGLIDIQGGTIYGGKDLNLYSSGDVNLKSLGFALENSATRVKNIKAYSGRDLIWNNADKDLPLITGKVQLDAANSLTVAAKEISSKDSIQLHANKVGLNSALTSQKDIDVSSEIADLVLSQTLKAQNNLTIASLDGKLTATGLNAVSTLGKISILGSKDTTFTNNGTVKTILKGDQGVVVGTSGTGNLTIQNTVLESQNGNIIATSGAQNNIFDSTLTAKTNIELFAKDNLTLDGIKSTSQQHTALNSKKNIYINSQAASGDTPSFSSTKTSELSSSGVLSVVSEKNQNIQNTKFTGGAVLVEAGGGLNTPKAVEFNATGSDLLKNNTQLNSLNGDLTIQTQNSLTIDPKVHKLSAIGDIELVSKNGSLTLEGYEGASGNGSEQVVKLSTAGGGISLEGTKIDIQGAQLTAQKDIKVISSKEDIFIDGIKNTLKDKSTTKYSALLNNDIGVVKTKIDNLKNSQEFKVEEQTYNNVISYKDVILKKIVDYFYANNDGLNPLNGVDLNNPFLFENLTFSTYYEEGWGLHDTIIINDSTYYFNPYLIRSDLDKYLTEVKKYKEVKNNNIPSRNKITELEGELNRLQTTVSFLAGNNNGYEHAESAITSNGGNISLTAARGVSISGANLTATAGQANIEARGPLASQYTSSTLNSGQTLPRTLAASIIIDGHTDFYDRGNEADTNYSMRTFISPTIINGTKGVNIKAIGNTTSDNLVLQTTGITASQGDVKIEANKSMLFDAAVEQSYDRSTATTTKKSWGGLKKKTTTTTEETNITNAASVDISGKNIYIETKKLAAGIDPKKPDNNIDIYSGRFTADGGQISIISGGNLNFYTAEETSSSKVDITKKSSFAGIKYNDSKTNTTRTQISELPAVLKADYIGTKSGFDTRLVGTEFEYLEGAHIESGGKIEFLAATKQITDLVKKDKNSVVWQSMQDKGSITETAKLPSFNGPVLPTFKAAGGLLVQVPTSEVDANKAELRNEILKLANQPGNTYLKDLVDRNDVDWQKVLLTQKDWDYKSQGLTGAGAALIVIIVTIVTMGSGTAAAAGAAGGTAASGTTVGLGASMLGTAGVTTTAAGAIVPSTLGVMANAAVTSLAAQASVGLINNGGDIGKTLKEMGSKDSIKNLAASVVTAGLLSQVGTALNLKPDSTLLSDRLVNNFTTSVGSTLVQTAINGGNLGDNLQVALLAGLAGALQGELASQIGTSLDKVDPNIFEYTIHKIAHAAVGCAAAAATKSSCEAGAIGAGVGEIVAGLMPEPANGIEYTDAEKLKIRNIGKLVSGTVAAYTGYDVNTAANSADIAIQNNSLVRLATTTGKLLVKAAEIYGDIKKANKGIVDPKVFVQKLKDQGVSELVGIADDLVTVFGPASTPFDRALAAFDLIIGTDLKPGKAESLKLAQAELDKLKVDQAYTLKVLQVKKDVVTRNRLNGKEFEMSAASKLGVKRNTDRQMITIKTERDGQINIIPDAFGNGGTLVEFKNVQYLTDTQQLRGYGATGKPVTLVVNMNTKISETVKNSILSNKGTIQRFDPIKNTLHPY
ncbi:DUF637 domain-containing protein, partial [Acinetobacter baumannii]|uniref:DUF637 domain-containing protein n=1 Tax=Acinetobacter baumannii TaxID=470 RepID=UPI003219E6A7